MKFLGGENWTLGGDIPGHPPPLYETLGAYCEIYNLRGGQALCVSTQQYRGSGGHPPPGRLIFRLSQTAPGEL